MRYKKFHAAVIAPLAEIIIKASHRGIFISSPVFTGMHSSSSVISMSCKISHIRSSERWLPLSLWFAVFFDKNFVDLIGKQISSRRRYLSLISQLPLGISENSKYPFSSVSVSFKAFSAVNSSSSCLNSPNTAPKRLVFEKIIYFWFSLEIFYFS